ncbi:MAG: putative DNA ligase, partial [Candidatus Daviesbacteria bacterium GW2011_GWA2_42_7]
MIFARFTEYLDKLEATSSRLSLIDILAQLFSEVSAGDIAKVVYLIQSRVAPFYEPIEMGMSEKLVAQAIARAYGIGREEVLKEYEKVGDLGKVAEKLSAMRHPELGSGSEMPKLVRHDGLGVYDVFETLLEIAKTSGVGTVEKKVNLLAGLLQKMDSVSAKHLARIPLGTSRLGVGDPTILDAFALAKLGDRKNRKELEIAYNKTSDLGLIGEVL